MGADDRVCRHPVEVGEQPGRCGVVSASAGTPRRSPRGRRRPAGSGAGRTRFHAARCSAMVSSVELPAVEAARRIGCRWGTWGTPGHLVRTRKPAGVRWASAHRGQSWHAAPRRSVRCSRVRRQGRAERGGGACGRRSKMPANVARSTSSAPGTGRPSTPRSPNRRGGETDEDQMLVADTRCDVTRRAHRCTTRSRRAAAVPARRALGGSRLAARVCTTLSTRPAR